MRIDIDQDIVILTIAVYLGVVFTNFFQAITRDILVPLTEPLIPKDEFGKLKVPFFGYMLDFGDVLLQTINVVVGVGMVILVSKFLRRYGKGVIQHLYK
jgi:large-conductance mechanosensitive channel